MRLIFPVAILPISILLLFSAPDSRAQSTCPSVHFNGVPSASLSPSTTTRLNLVRQSDGSYTSYETTNTSPYRLLSATQNFQEQLTACLPPATAAQNPAPVAPANPVGSPSQPQAVALLGSGEYLIVSPNSSSGIDAAVFSPQMGLISVSSYALSPVSPNGLSLADLNGDGKPDIIAVTNGSERAPGLLTIMLGQGGSSFQSPTTYFIQSTLVQLNSFAIGDLNGDHKVDIAVAVRQMADGPGSIASFLGNGDGTFQPGPSTTLASLPIWVAVADLNGDGKLDLAAVVDSNYVSFGYEVAVALGNGDGSFATPTYIPAPQGSIAIGDMNADGIPDIVTAGTILFGDGAGAFPNRQDYDLPQAANASPGAVILADFNGDGRQDIVIAGGTPALLTGLAGSSVTVLFAQPDGTYFGPAISIASGVYTANTFIADLHRADFNGDGIPDFAYGGLAGVGTMLGKGDGTFVSSFFSSSPRAWYLAPGDFNRDGNQDLVALLPYPETATVLSFFAGKGDGTFQPARSVSLPDSPADLVSGDFNGDGKLDLAVMSSTQNDGTVDAVDIYLGNGDGSFQQGKSYPTGLSANWILAGDLNNDGTPDLVVTTFGSQTQSGTVSALLGKGDGTFAPGTPIPLAVRQNEGFSGTMFLADFNGDGWLDVAVTTNPGFAILLGKGDGTFQAPLTNPLSAGSIAAGDLNGDGVLDLMVTTGDTGAFPASYLLGNGDGSFQSPVPVGVLAGPALLIADVNRDGRPDLVSPALPLGFFSLLNLTPGPPFQVVSSASFSAGPVAADSFVSAFGTNLPASAAGLSILVTDSAGVSRPAAPLYASPTQINFIMPAGTSRGVATVSITSPGNATPLAPHVEIAPIAAGLFTENALGLAAAYAVRIDAQGNQSYQTVFNVQNGTVVATPLDLGSSSDRVYLSLFGTGFDSAGVGSVNVTIAGQTAPVSYAGPQGLAGLDQVNILLPHGLAGSGNSSVVLSASGSFANPVDIVVQ
jgi:uncharacterized protein (TIGR03437 family)